MNRKGQALVEFVLILPVFLMILFTIVDFGNLLHSKTELQNQNVSKIMLTIEDKRYIIKNYGTTYIENKNEIIAITMYLSYENSVIILIDNRTSHEISFDLEIFK